MHGQPSSPDRHIHVSLRDANGRSIFALPDAEVKTGRANAQYEDTKFLSQEGEWFLAGVLRGLPDSKSILKQFRPFTHICVVKLYSYACSTYILHETVISILILLLTARTHYQRVQTTRGW